MYNWRTFRCNFLGGRFHMIPQSYKSSHGVCLDNFLQVFSIGNQRDQVTPFIYINRSNEVSHLVRGRKKLGNMKYLMRSVKPAVEAVVIWTEENQDGKRVYSLYTMVSWRLKFKIDKRFDSLSCLLLFRDMYTMRGYIIGELNEEQEQALAITKRRRDILPFSFWRFSILLGY